MRDDEYTVTARALLGQPLQAEDGAVCQNKHATGPSAGQLCGVTVGWFGLHSYVCGIGGGIEARSSAVVKSLADVHKDCKCAATNEVHVTT